jgi:uncharacterized protein with ParB-like and HNH nuclease domain
MLFGPSAMSDEESNVAKSAFQTAIPVREVVDKIQRRNYLLPAIQREFVWPPDKIVRLFDSLMRDYTIGSFLFWAVDKSKLKDFQFYEFVRTYNQKEGTHNPKANVTGEDSITAILDGQQRFTAFHLGLKGTYALKLPWKRRENSEAYPEKSLYLNLLSSNPEESDLSYDFRFLTPLEAQMRDENAYWFKVGDILELRKLNDVYNYLRKNGLITSQFAQDSLVQLYEVINQKGVINFYLETSQELDKVLNEFIRVNSAGTPLSYSDLLLSIATAKWETRDARESITRFVDEINAIRDRFDFDKDFVLKSCLVLTDIADIAFKVDNFTTANMSKIERLWEDITKAIRLSVELVASFGYNTDTLPSTLSLIPIAYHLKRIDAHASFINSAEYAKDRELIKRWLAVSLIKRAFSGQPDSVLRPIRNILSEGSKGFPFQMIVDRFKGTTKSLTFSQEDLDAVLHLEYAEPHTFSVLSLLYQTLDFRNKFHIDHIHPKSLFKKSELKARGFSREKEEYYVENCNVIGNLQLLEGVPNLEKSDKPFDVWLEEQFHDPEARNDYMRRNLIPVGVKLNFDSFDKFIEARNHLIRGRLEGILGELMTTMRASEAMADV